VFNWLFYQCYGSLARMLQPSEENLPTLLRLVSLAWALCGGLVTFLFLKTYRPTLSVPSRLRTVIAAGVALVAWLGPNVGWWALTARPDVAAVCCEALGLLIMLQDGPRWPRFRALLAAGLFFAGWSFKQSAVGLFIGTAFGLALRREWANILVLVAGFGTLAGMVLLLSGESYFSNVFLAPALAPWVPNMVVQNVGLWVYYWGFVLLILPAVLFLCYQPTDRRRLLRTRAVFIVLMALIVSLATSLLASGRFGAWSNYYFEPWIAGMLLTGMVFLHAAGEFQAFESRLDRRLLVGWATAIALLAVAYTVCAFWPPFTWDGVRMVREPYRADELDAVRRSARPLFCDDPRLLRLALGAEARDIPVIDYTLYGDAVKSGRVQDGGVTARIADRWYATLWLRPGKSPWEPVAVQAGYRLEVDGGVRKYARPAD
jgi:hypothetical protein